MENIALEENVEKTMEARLNKYLWHLRREDSKKIGTVFEFMVESRRDEDEDVHYHLLSG